MISLRLDISVHALALDGKLDVVVIIELVKAFDIRVRDFIIVFGGLGLDKRLLSNRDIALLSKRDEVL